MLPGRVSVRRSSADLGFAGHHMLLARLSRVAAQNRVNPVMGLSESGVSTASTTVGWPSPKRLATSLQVLTWGANTSWATGSCENLFDYCTEERAARHFGYALPLFVSDPALTFPRIDLVFHVLKTADWNVFLLCIYLMHSFQAVSHKR